MRLFTGILGFIARWFWRKRIAPEAGRISRFTSKFERLYEDYSVILRMKRLRAGTTELFDWRVLAKDSLAPVFSTN